MYTCILNSHIKHAKGTSMSLSSRPIACAMYCRHLNVTVVDTKTDLVFHIKHSFVNKGRCTPHIKTAIRYKQKLSEEKTAIRYKQRRNGMCQHLRASWKYNKHFCDVCSSLQPIRMIYTCFYVQGGDLRAGGSRFNSRECQNKVWLFLFKFELQFASWEKFRNYTSY